MPRTISDVSIAKALLPIYDTTTDPSRWPETLDTVARAIGAVGGGVYVRRIDDQPFNLVAISSIYNRMDEEEYLSNYAHYEAAQWSYLNAQKPLEIVLDDMAGVPREVLNARPDYLYTREKCGIGRRVALRLNAIPSWYDAAIFGFDMRYEDIPQASLGALQPLLPHLAKAVEVGRAFAMLRARYKAALAALDHVHVGLAIALPSGEIIVSNAEMDRIFARADGLRLDRNRHLACGDPDCRSRIEAAVREAAGTLHGERNRPESLGIIQRPSGLHPFLLEIVPLADSGAELDRDLAGALITVIDPDGIAPASASRFAALHGLTAAETAVCGFLVDGMTVLEIAERRGAGPETVKAQSRAIMAKTGARNRGDLIRKVLRTLPPVG